MINMRTIDIFNKLIIQYPALSVCISEIKDAYQIMFDAYDNNGKMLIAGNGGSAADALHITGELMKSFKLPRKLSIKDVLLFKDAIGIGKEDCQYLCDNLQKALPTISLVSEDALMTAYANDNVSNLVFAQEVFGLGNQGDVLLAISTSGNSKNIIYAAQTAQAKRLKVIGLTGKTGGKLKAYCNVCICAPSVETYRIQEYHLPIYHTICLALENQFYGENK